MNVAIAAAIETLADPSATQRQRDIALAVLRNAEVL